MIVVAVIILALLTVVGIAATKTSTTEVQISTNAVLHNIAFYTVDSGIEAGRATLNNIKIEDAGSWDNLLFNIDADAGTEKSIKKRDPVACAPDETCDCTPDPCYTLNDIIDQITPGGRTVGPATYTLTVVDNDDLDGNVEVDSDDTVFLTSTLVSPHRNATATISTTVRGGGEAYAQEHYNAGSSGESAAESGQASVDERWGL
jgi:type IV pilus assembly protein PilX